MKWMVTLTPPGAERPLESPLRYDTADVLDGGVLRLTHKGEPVFYSPSAWFSLRQVEEA